MPGAAERPASGVRGSLVAGIDLGGTKILAAIVDARGRILGESKRRTRAEAGPDAVIARMADCVRQAAADAGVDWKRIRALGVGCPGPLDPRRGVILFAPNLGWRDVPLQRILEKALDVPVRIDNDVNVGTLAEARLGAVKGKSNVVGIFVGTGIGGGIVLNGNLYRGFNQNAGEIGHMIIRKGGARCSCGARGCLEAYAGRNAILARIRKAVKAGRETVLTEISGEDLRKVRSRELRDAARAGDAVVLKALNRAARYLGVAVANLANLLSPEAFVLGGGVIEAVGDVMMPRIREAAGKNALPGALDDVVVTVSELGDSAGVLGAAILARETLSGSPPE